MVVQDISEYVAIGKEIIVYSKEKLKNSCELKIRYKIDKETKEIKLYDVPRILTFQEKCIIYYAILENFCFYPLGIINREFRNEKIEDYIVKENGYTYHEFNSLEGENNGILGELLFEIPRQEIEAEKLSKMRDIYEMLIRNLNEIGEKPICIAFNGIMPDFKDIYKAVIYVFRHDRRLIEKQKECFVYKKKGFLGSNKRIFIIPRKMLY